MARNKFPGSQASLDALCKKFSIDNSRRVTHTALIDCDLLSRVYINLIDQKEPTLNFKNQETEFKSENNSKISYFKKVVQPTADEIEEHKKYLKVNLKKNNFN